MGLPVASLTILSKTKITVTVRSTIRAKILELSNFSSFTADDGNDNVEVSHWMCWRVWIIKGESSHRLLA